MPTKSRRPKAPPVYRDRQRKITVHAKEITRASGNKVLFSYETPVAAYIAAEGKYYSTDVFYSATTLRHISLWLQSLDVTWQIDKQPQSFFINL